MPSSHLIFCRPLLLLPLIPPSIRVFFNESPLCMRWPKYWSFSFSISSLSFLHSPTFTSILDHWKNHSPLTRQTFVVKVMSLLFNMLSRLVITFLPRSKCLLISWLQSPSSVILEPPKIKSDTISTVSPSISHEVMGPVNLDVLRILCSVLLSHLTRNERKL